MIARLTGTLAENAADHAVLDVGKNRLNLTYFW